MSRWQSLLIALTAAGAVSASVYAIAVRPSMRRWGATDEEVHKTLPGDELASPTGYRAVSTRAITIDAPPAEVWPPRTVCARG